MAPAAAGSLVPQISSIHYSRGAPLQLRKSHLQLCKKSCKCRGRPLSEAPKHKRKAERSG